MPMLLALLGLLGSSALVVHGTLAAYAVPTSNAGSALAAGTVALSDDDGGSALFTVTGAKPGESTSRCIATSYSGSLPAAVTLFAASSSGALRPYVDLAIEEGVSSSAFSSCAGFSPTSTAYVGTLTAFASAATSYATGVGSFAPPGAGQARAYRITATVQADAPDASQGTTAAVSLRWEARNVAFSAARAAGLNTGGQLGVGDTTERLAFTPVGTDTDWATISAGVKDSCAVEADGTLWCWGLNNTGLVDGSGSPRPSPTQVGVDADWATVSVGNVYACAIKTDRTLWCWGYNVTGQLGLDDTTRRTAPTKVGTATWRTVSAGGTHTCAIQTTGTLWCWGDGSTGRIGDGTSTQRLAPVQVGSATTWTAVSNGIHHSCGISAGRAYCWGSSSTWNIGDGTNSASQASPVEVAGNATDWTTISAGGSNGNKHACATRADGTLWCWGANASYQLGTGDTAVRKIPTQIGASTQWATVATGLTDADRCALRRDRTLWCWGSNSSGQLGTGDKLAVTTPTQRATGVRQVAYGYNHVLTLGWPGP